jgi:hypothetical protein
MAVTEGKHAGEFIVSDRGEDSRDAVTVLSGQVLVAGEVVGKVGLGVGAAAIPTVVGTGNGTMSALFAGPDVQAGAYVVTLLTAVAHGGVFTVVAPDGTALPNLTLTPGAGGTTTYRTSHINFSITDGSTDFIVGDAFTITVAAATSATVVGTGNGTLTGITAGPIAKTGRYQVKNIATITNGGTFQVTDPDGDVVAVGSITAGAGGTLVLANQAHLNLTITDGSTDFVAGDFFEVYVFNLLVAKVAQWDPTAVDGRQHAAGIAWDNYDATAADLKGVIESRWAVVNAAELSWKSTVSAAQKIDGQQALTALGVVVR